MSYAGSIQRHLNSVGSANESYTQAAADYNTASWLWLIAGAIFIGGIIWDRRHGRSI